MKYVLSIPGATDDMSELRVLQWHVQPGETVTVDQLLVELETHKAIVEVRAAQEAVLRQHLCEEGDWGLPGRSLAVLSDDVDEALPEGDGPVLAASFEIC
jgi:pyruvate/2-oxoglutarate dehydrogenase complex dihydrolipoamide acyltransferase (E2) component